MAGIKTMGNDRQWDITMVNNLQCELQTMGKYGQWELVDNGEYQNNILGMTDNGEEKTIGNYR